MLWWVISITTRILLAISAENSALTESQYHASADKISFRLFVEGEPLLPPGSLDMTDLVNPPQVSLTLRWHFCLNRDHNLAAASAAGRNIFSGQGMISLKGDEKVFFTSARLAMPCREAAAGQLNDEKGDFGTTM